MGCGTGALSAAILAQCAPSLVIGIEPSAGFLKAAKENLAGRALVFQGSATSIPIDDAAMDVVVSGLVLNFVPDPRAALVEMMRVTRRGGTIAAYVWDYAGKMAAHTPLLGCGGRARPRRRIAARRHPFSALPPGGAH